MFRFTGSDHVADAPDQCVAAPRAASLTHQNIATASAGQVIALLALVAALIPTFGFAEGRDDPFLRCAFEGGRQVILSERGDDFVWTEDKKGTVAAFLQRADGDPLASLYTYLPTRGAQVLTLDLDAMAAAAGSQPPVGTAMIVTPTRGNNGRLTPTVQYGRCVEFIG